MSLKIISHAHLESANQGEEKLLVKNAFIHPLGCEKALIKLSRYEQFEYFIDEITQSRYDQKTHELFFKIDHFFFPKSLYLQFKLPRITKPGQYSFIFEKGFLKNLKGEITIANADQKCFMGLQASWQGPNTPFPKAFLEMAIITLNRLAMEKLIRISK